MLGIQKLGLAPNGWVDSVVISALKGEVGLRAWLKYTNWGNQIVATVGVLVEVLVKSIQSLAP